MLRCFLVLTCLLLATSAHGDAPAAAAAAPLLQDAYGREIDIGAIYLEKYQEMLTSEEWGAFATEVFAEEGQTWARLLASGVEEKRISEAYREAHPASAAEEYDSWLGSEEGDVAAKQWAVHLLEDKELGPATLDGYQAMYELLIVVQNVFADARAAMAAAGPAGAPLDPGLGKLLRSQALAYLPTARCLMQEVSRQVPPRAFADGSGDLVEALRAAYQSGACPEPAAVALPAELDPTLPFDGYGRARTLESSMAAQLEPFLGSWTPVALDLAIREGVVWPRAIKSLQIDNACSRQYRELHPASQAADYDALYASAEGLKWLAACTRKLLAHPQRGSELADGLQAQLELSALFRLVRDLHQVHQAAGNAEDAEISPELELRAFRETRDRLMVQRCAVAKAVAKVGLDVLAESIGSDQAEITAAIEDNVRGCLPAGFVKDSFGRLLNIAWELEMQVTKAAGSTEWAHFVVEANRLDSVGWKRIAGVLEGQMACSAEYRGKFPQASAAEHDAFFKTPEGIAFNRDCMTRAMAHPDKGELVRSGLLATIEFGTGAQTLVQQRKAWLKEKGREESGAIPAEDQEAVRDMTSRLNTGLHCLFTEAAKKVPVEKMLDRSGALGPALNEVIASGVCDPEEKSAG